MPLDMPLLQLYRCVALLATPLAGPALNWRAARGKEDRARLGERMGRSSRPRPPGRLVWLHGASLGEGLSLLPLVDRLVQMGVETLVTTGTVTSAQTLGARLPAGAVHQYAPLDSPRFVASFLDHWRPDVAIFAESELWPNMIAGLRARQIPLALANARLSEASAARWGRGPATARKVFGAVDLCLAQDADNAERFRSLGATNVRVAGNLKFDAPSPPVDAARLAAFAAAIGPRPVWAAVSTHPEEEAAILDAHALLAQQLPGLLTLIAPRHPERGGPLAERAGARGLSVARRSGAGEPAPDTQIFIADTVGELGVVFRSADLAFMGKSLVAPGGGQNPIEPARCGCAVLHGPHVDNFTEVYAKLDADKGAAKVDDAAALARAAQVLLTQPATLRRMGRAAATSVETLGGAARATIAAIEPWLAQRRAPGRR
jgi:3-deoxy-D-manno-octulosonic-acid transferase